MWGWWSYITPLLWESEFGLQNNWLSKGLLKNNTQPEASSRGAFPLLTIMRELSVLPSDTVLSQVYQVDVQYFIWVPHSGSGEVIPGKTDCIFWWDTAEPATPSRGQPCSMNHKPKEQLSCIGPRKKSYNRTLTWITPMLKTNVFSMWPLWPWTLWWQRWRLGVGLRGVPDKEIRPLPLAWLFWDLFIHSPWSWG